MSDSCFIAKSNPVSIVCTSTNQTTKTQVKKFLKTRIKFQSKENKSDNNSSDCWKPELTVTKYLILKTCFKCNSEFRLVHIKGLQFELR